MRQQYIYPLLSLLCLSVVLFSATASANDTQPILARGTAEEVNMDPLALARAVAMVRHSVEDDEIPAAVILVARHGKVVLEQAFGHRDFDRTDPIATDALFRMASNSKAVTAAGIMVLVDDGAIDLDTAVGNYLPAFDNPGWQDVTIRHLLTHTSGCRLSQLFFTPLLPPEAAGDKSRLVAEVERFASVAPQKPPGQTYSYNNAAFNILAGVIEQVTGSYEEHLRRRIYTPLGMNDSCNHESKADHDRMSTVMRRKEDGSWQAGWTPGDAPDWPFPRGSGGMVTTAWDYAIFCQLHLNKGRAGETQVLSVNAVEEMTTPQSEKCPAAVSYGLGWKVTEAGGTYSHTGSDGTYVFVNPELQLTGMLLTQTNNAVKPQQAFRELVEAACNDYDQSPSDLAADVRQPDGYYKDVFMSSGKNLTSRKTLPAADSLDLSYEYYAGSDVMLQNKLIVGNTADTNGVLLYPDGAPRFRMIYVNGGAASAHGKSLTVAGRQRIRDFVSAGGSYCGSCAGSFLAGRNVDKRTEPRETYLNIFPFNTLNTGLKKSRLLHSIPTDSPLLRYRSFGDDSAVADVYHNNGNWLKIDAAKMKKVEVLATYDSPGHKIDGGAAIWAYHDSASSGRVVSIGCHPEGSRYGESLALTEATFLHALDGNGQPQLKSTLQLGVPRVMDRSTEDQQPEFTRIGDRQYHHFAFTVPETARPSSSTASSTSSSEPSELTTKTIRIELSSDTNSDLHLCLRRESFAFRKEADVIAVESGSNKTLLQELAPGRWYLSVFCASGVDSCADPASGLYRYVSDRAALNGIPYTITISEAQEPPGV